MSDVGSFTVTTPNFGSAAKSGSASFSFASANFDPPGTTPDQLESIQEELTDTGVTGRRWRQVYQQFAPFSLLTTADAASYDAAIQIKRDCQTAKGSIGKLAITLDGQTYSYSSVKVTDVIVRIQKGFLVGSAATGGSSAIIYARWSMVFADVTKPGVS